MISSSYFPSCSLGSIPSVPSVNHIAKNLKKISSIAIPLLAAASIPSANGLMYSYLACAATCPAMALAVAHTGLSSYTYEACMKSCLWMLSPSCP